MTKSDNINELATALAKAQGAIQGAIKDSTNPFFKSNYADLASVWGSCRKALSENGLSVVQTTDSDNLEIVVVHTMLLHSSGQYITGSLSMKPVKMDPQGIGSAISYARRYALAAIAGIYQEDDDANRATGEIFDRPMLKVPLKGVVSADVETRENTEPAPDVQPPPESLSMRLTKALAGLVELTGRDPADLIGEFSSFDEKKAGVKTGVRKSADSIEQLVKSEKWGRIVLKKMEESLLPPREAGSDDE